MIIYHGHATRKSLRVARKAAPSYIHGVEYASDIFRVNHGAMVPYIIDNGAFAAYKKDMPWDEEQFMDMLDWADSHPRDPDFVVVPDVVADSEATYERSREWVTRIPYPTHQPVQDGMEFGRALDMAEETGSEGIFIGGTKEWKKRKAREWVRRAHDRGMRAHIARPGNLMWAERIGADSVDTTNIVRNQSWEKLRYLENQITFEEWER